ncbi:hypothetical protein MKEN_00495300 [Mycena kentingensis (nom. inval.)]|nr:hypothetical protein MKEN_00495300 [Mycena kentingensis (nom. inval.)]
MLRHTRARRSHASIWAGISKNWATISERPRLATTSMPLKNCTTRTLSIPPVSLFSTPTRALSTGSPLRSAAEYEDTTPDYAYRARTLVFSGISPGTPRGDLWKAIKTMKQVSLARLELSPQGDEAYATFGSIADAYAFFLFTQEAPLVLGDKPICVDWDPQGPGEPSTALRIDNVENIAAYPSVRVLKDCTAAGCGYVFGVTTSQSEKSILIKFKHLVDAFDAFDRMRQRVGYTTPVRVRFSALSEPVHTLYLPTLPPRIDKLRIRKDLMRFGTVEEVSVHRNHGYATMRMEEEKDAVAALEALKTSSASRYLNQLRWWWVRTDDGIVGSKGRSYRAMEEEGVREMPGVE